MLLLSRLLLLLLFRGGFISHFLAVVLDDASGSGAHHSVTAGDVPRHSAYSGSL